MSQSEDGSDVVVLDNGSGFVKCGFGGASFPTSVFNTHIGRPVLRAGSKVVGKELKPVMIGDETKGANHLLEISRPINNGVIRDYDEMMKIWDYAFTKKMNIDPKERPLLISQPPLCGSPQRAKMFEHMFEHYNFAEIQMSPQGVLSLYSAGLDTGIAVDAGEGMIHCTPVYQGFGFIKGNKSVSLGGREVTEQLIKLLQKRGYHFNPVADFETARAIKERFCFCAADLKKEAMLARETVVLESTFTLPDGSKCTIGSERFEATEVLFNPGLIDHDCDGLSQTVWNSINACDSDVRAKLYEHVVLSGGTTMFPGLPTRLENDIKKWFLEQKLGGDKSKLGNFKLNIEDPPRRKYMVFLGGAVLAQLTAGNHESWVTKAEWDEEGPKAIIKKFGSL